MLANREGVGKIGETQPRNPLAHPCSDEGIEFFAPGDGFRGDLRSYLIGRPHGDSIPAQSVAGTGLQCPCADSARWQVDSA